MKYFWNKLGPRKWFEKNNWGKFTCDDLTIVYK